MKINLNEDINSYSYTGPGFADDRINLGNYTGDDGYVELVKDGKTLYVTSAYFSVDSDYDFYREYSTSELDTAIRDFNTEVKRFGGVSKLRRIDVEMVLDNYGIEL